MTTAGTVLLSLVVAALVVAAISKRKAITGLGLFTKDKKGRLVMVLTPARKKRKRRR